MNIKSWPRKVQPFETAKTFALSGDCLFSPVSTAISWFFLLWVFGITLCLPKIVLAEGVDDVYELIDSARLPDTLVQINSLLDKSPDDPDLLFIRALIAEKNSGSEKAIQYYQGLIQSHPDLLEPYNNLAIHYANAGDYKQAIKTLEQAMQANPTVAIAYRNLSAIYTQLASAAYHEALDSTTSPEPLQLLPLNRLDSMRFLPTGEQSLNDKAELVPVTKPDTDKAIQELAPVTSIELEPAVEPPVLNSAATPSQTDPE